MRIKCPIDIKQHWKENFISFYFMSENLFWPLPSSTCFSHNALHIYCIHVYRIGINNQVNSQFRVIDEITLHLTDEITVLFMNSLGVSLRLVKCIENNIFQPKL